MRDATVFLSAAEASGDAHGARLVQCLQRRLPGARLVGVGGPRMAGAGCRIVEDLTARASMLGGALLRLPYYWRQVRRLTRALRAAGPDIHVPIDSPALNWHLAAAAKDVGAKVVHYVAPQVWAWAPWRVKKLARLSDHVACILPFEEEYLRSRGVQATYVGHPLLDALPARTAPPPDLMEAWLEGTWRVALLPGSRPDEIAAHAPALAAVAAAVSTRWPRAAVTFAAPSPQSAQRLRDAASRMAPGISVVAERTAEVLAASHFAVAASGTVTLEAAYFGVPMVIVYRTGRLGYHLLARWLIRTPHLSLVNILAGRRLVPEIMPWHGDVPALTRTVLEAMQDLGGLLETRQELLGLVDPLRPADGRPAADHAADIICRLLE